MVFVTISPFDQMGTWFASRRNEETMVPISGNAYPKVRVRVSGQERLHGIARIYLHGDIDMVIVRNRMNDCGSHVSHQVHRNEQTARRGFYLGWRGSPRRVLSHEDDYPVVI